MGTIASKLFKFDSKSSKGVEERRTETPMGTEISDPRSPTGNIWRTPIFVDKKCEKDGNEESVPLRTKLLKNIKLDPRSPTVGIYRTPIVVEDLDKNSGNFDSPVSIYSSNLSDSVVLDVVTPAEPSVNVSGFENEKDAEEGSELDDTLGVEDDLIRKPNVELKVLEKPSTYEARKLLEEMTGSDDENFIKKAKIRTKERRENAKPYGNRIVNDFKGNKTKSRTPLSNITSSANSPNQMNQTGKFGSRNKMLAEFGSENPNATKHLAQWDQQNNTVII